MNSEKRPPSTFYRLISGEHHDLVPFSCLLPLRLGGYSGTKPLRHSPVLVRLGLSLFDLPSELDTLICVSINHLEHFIINL